MGKDILGDPEMQETPVKKDSGLVVGGLSGIALIIALAAGPDYIREADAVKMKTQAGTNAVLITGQKDTLKGVVVTDSAGKPEIVKGDTVKKDVQIVQVAERKFNPLFYGTIKDTIEVLCRIKRADGTDTCFAMGEFTSDSIWLPDVSVRLQPSAAQKGK